MENPISDFFEMQDGAVVNGDTPSGISPYISCIRINGKPILPPLITDERRKELIYYRRKAVEIEKRLLENKRRCATFVKGTTTSTSENSLIDLSPNRQSTPARPVTLQLMPNMPAKSYILTSSSDSNVNKSSSDQVNKDSDSMSSQKSTNKTRSKLFRSTLEQRLANEEISLHNKKNLYEQSPIIEENYPLYMNEGGGDVDDLKQDLKRWSPLNTNSISSLRVDSRNSQIADSSFVSIDDAETLTGSPNLMRQNSYTLLTPSPALLHYLETQKDEEHNRRSHSGRKTWDLTNAKKKWSPATGDKGGNREAMKESSSEGYPVHQRGTQNSYTDDGSTSPSSYSFKATSPKLQKIKCKIKSRRVKPHKSVPSPKPNDKVPKFGNSPQGPESVFVPFQVKEELTDLSNLFMKMKMEHERQKKELEEKQKSEMKELELLFKRRETELLRRVAQDSPVCPRSIYSQYSDPGEGGKFYVQMVGDGRHNATDPSMQGCGMVEDRTKRPQSAKDYYTPCIDQESRRTRSMDFNQPIPNQDTDLDISFQDSLQSKEYMGNEDIDTDTISNCSGESSTLSSDSKLESMPLLDVKKFRTMEMTPEDFEKYNQAAAVITAAARGFLTRRLLRTSHVQGLITTLRDAISCATQLHGATDLGESDVDLMKRLGRQIEAAWEAVYSVFFETDPSTKMQLISADRERLRSISTKLSGMEPKKRISSATLKSLRRKSGSDFLMTRSQITNGSNSGSRKIRSRMVASYPSPSAQYKLK